MSFKKGALVRKSKRADIVHRTSWPLVMKDGRYQSTATATGTMVDVLPGDLCIVLDDEIFEWDGNGCLHPICTLRGHDIQIFLCKGIILAHEYEDFVLA